MSTFLRVRKSYNDDNEFIADSKMSLSPYILYNTNVYEITPLPEDTVDSPNYILLKPNTNIMFGDWIEKDGQQYKIRKIKKIEYKSKEYLIRVEY